MDELMVGVESDRRAPDPRDSWRGTSSAENQYLTYDFQRGTARGPSPRRVVRLARNGCRGGDDCTQHER